MVDEQPMVGGICVLEGIGLRGRWVRGLKLEGESVSLKEETELVRFQVA